MRENHRRRKAAENPDVLARIAIIKPGSMADANECAGIGTWLLGVLAGECEATCILCKTSFLDGARLVIPGAFVLLMASHPEVGNCPTALCRQCAENDREKLARDIVSSLGLEGVVPILAQHYAGEGSA